MSGLDFMLMRDETEWNAETDRHLEGHLSLTSWESLFFKVLGCPDSPRVEGESREEFRRRWTKEFREAIPEYPLLGRISYFFHDVWYKLEEVAELRAECLKVKNGTDDTEALEGLNSLIIACDEAEKHKLGLFLGAD